MQTRALPRQARDALHVCTSLSNLNFFASLPKFSDGKFGDPLLIQESKLVIGYFNLKTPRWCEESVKVVNRVNRKEREYPQRIGCRE